MREAWLGMALWLGAGLAAVAPVDAAWAVPPAVDAVLDGVDKNLTFDSRTTTVTMKVEANNRVREFQMKTWGRGSEDAAIEYLAPARDKGTKMLRKGAELWMWMPSVERTQKISGHALRQGLMGSDVSYEDLLGASRLRDAYTAKLLREEALDGRPCVVLELTAKDAEQAYARRVAWVDVEALVPLKQELYAVSGLLLKTWEMSGITPIGDRKVPSRMVIRDQVKKGSTTTLELTDIQFGVALEEEIFSQRWLER